MNILSFLLKNWKNVLLILLIFYITGSIRHCSRQKSDIEVLSHANDSLYNTARLLKNNNDHLVNRVNTHELTIKQLKEYGGQLGFDADKLKKENGTLKGLVAHWKGKAVSSGSFTTTLKDTTINTMDPTMDLVAERPDTTINPGIAKAFEWSNNHLSLHGIISENSITLKYDYQSAFTITPYYKKQGFFKKPQLVTDIWFDDENMKIQEFRGFVVTQPKLGFFQTPIGQIGLCVGGFAAGYGLGRLSGQ